MILSFNRIMKLYNNVYDYTICTPNYYKEYYGDKYLAGYYSFCIR